MIALLKRCFNRVKAFFSILIGIKPKEVPKPPIDLSRIIIRESPPHYQDRKTRPGWVNNLFDDYIRGKIPSLTHLRRAIATEEAGAHLTKRNIL